jgi:NADH:ubiquinone oxidoreductase subunit K
LQHLHSHVGRRSLGRKKERRSNNIIMSELLDFVIVSMVLVAVGIYGLVVKRNAIRMLFSIEIIVNAANLLLVAFSRGLPNAQGQVVALFSIAIAAAEVAVGLGLIIVAYRLYKEIDVAELRSMRG